MTGSVPTGKAIMKSAAEHMTKVSLELGGKAPAIVCAGIDSASSSTCDGRGDGVLVDLHRPRHRHGAYAGS